MVRAGLGPGWRCLLANDFDPRKSESYRQNWPGAELKTADVASATTRDLPGVADLAWASFPCQDLSLAGDGAGLKGDRSGAFWPFWRLMRGLVEEARPPHRGSRKCVRRPDLARRRRFRRNPPRARRFGISRGRPGGRRRALCSAITAVLFIIAVHGRCDIPGADGPSDAWHERITPPSSLRNWIWWNPPVPPRRATSFSDLIEENPPDVEWFSKEYTQQLPAKMSDRNRAKLHQARRGKRKDRSAALLLTDPPECSERAEVRFDGLSGCLRTPVGGSSRQIILVVDGPRVRARLISSRETARLMGLPDSYILPENYNEAYHLTGDGVVVPVAPPSRRAYLRARAQFVQVAYHSGMTRSQTMRAVKSKDTTPELFIRRLLHAKGFRYRLHRTDLPGCPISFSAA